MSPLSTNRRPRAIKLLPAPVSSADPAKNCVRDSIYIIPKSFSLFFMPFGRDRYRRVGPSRSRMRKLINGDSITVSNSAFNSLTGDFFIFVAIISNLPHLYVVTWQLTLVWSNERVERAPFLGGRISSLGGWNHFFCSYFFTLTRSHASLPKYVFK